MEERGAWRKEEHGNLWCYFYISSSQQKCTVSASAIKLSVLPQLGFPNKVAKLHLHESHRQMIPTVRRSFCQSEFLSRFVQALKIGFECTYKSRFFRGYTLEAILYPQFFQLYTVILSLGGSQKNRFMREFSWDQTPAPLVVANVTTLPTASRPR